MKCLVGTDSWLKRADGSRVKVELLKGKERGYSLQGRKVVSEQMGELCCVQGQGFFL